MGSHVESQATDGTEMMDDGAAGGTCPGSDTEMDRVATTIEGVSDAVEMEGISEGDGEAEAEVDELRTSDDDVPLSRMLGPKGKGKARAATEEGEGDDDNGRDGKGGSVVSPSSPLVPAPVSPDLPTLTGRRGTLPKERTELTQTWAADPMVCIGISIVQGF